LNRRTAPILTGSRIQDLSKESTNLPRGGHTLGISPEPRKEKAGNQEKRSNPLVLTSRVLETAAEVSEDHGLQSLLGSFMQH
jgi:hypothetical protein